MFRKTTQRAVPMPEEILAWQVELRRHTMQERAGKPHVGVAPVLTVRTPGIGAGHSAHSIICGLLPAEPILARKTEEFRRLYEEYTARGARAVYDAGLAYLEKYYERPEDFDATSITTLLGKDSPALTALGAAPDCSLLFYVFDLEDRSRIGRLRCVQLHCRAEVHRDGPVFDNVWWHNTLFHGPADDQVVVRFRHQVSYETGFGRLERVQA
jgi:hypothetical protein